MIQYLSNYENKITVKMLSAGFPDFDFPNLKTSFS